MGSGHPPAGGAHSAGLPSPRGGGYSSGLDTISRVSSAFGECPANRSSRAQPAAPARHRSTVPECRLDCRRDVRTMFDVIGVSALRGHGGLARLNAYFSWLNELTPMPPVPATVPVPETEPAVPAALLRQEIRTTFLTSTGNRQHTLQGPVGLSEIQGSTRRWDHGSRIGSEQILEVLLQLRVLLGGRRTGFCGLRSCLL